MDKMRIALIGFIMMMIGSIGYASQTIYFKVDMTVVWAVDLPKAVYVVFDGSVTATNMKQIDAGRERDIYLNYNDTYRKTGVEQDTAHCMELTDSDYDGIYTGTMEYTGSTSGTYKTRLFISKNDKNNTMGNPIYEVWCNTASVDYMGWAARNIAIGTSGTQTLNWGWEYKAISGWRSLSGNPNTGTSGSNTSATGSITLHSGFSKKLVLNAAFHNDSAVTRDVSKSVVIVSGNKSIADVEKVTDSNGNVTYAKIVAKGAGTTTLVLGVGIGSGNYGDGVKYYKEFSLTVNVTDSTINAGDQTVIWKPLGGITNTDSLGVDSNLTLNVNPRIVGLTSDTTTSIIKSSYDYTSFYYFTVSTISYGNGYAWWTPSIAANGVIVPVTSYTSKNLNFTTTNTTTGNTALTEIKMPTHVASVTMTTGANPEFTWSESVSENANYTSRYTIARICKIGTTGTSIKFNPYAGNAAVAGNPIIDASGSSTAVSNFDASPATAAYIDYVFSSASTKMSKDGRAVKKNENTATGVQTLTLMQFPIGEYKLQIYTIKGNSISGYSVLTFETEEAFEITKEDYISSLQSTDDSYIINDVNPSGFDKININFTTRTAKTISAAEMLDRVVYNGTTLGVNKGVKEYKKNSTTSIFAATGNNNTNLLSDGSLMQITKVSDNDTNRIPMDVILCLDRTTSMGSKMTAIQNAWTNFEAAMSEKGYDVKYQLVSFGGSAFGWNYETTSWQSSLQGLYSSKFTGTSSETGYGYDDAYSAIEYCIDIMEGTVAGTAGGRYYGYNSSTGQWGAVTTVTQTPSEKVVIFMTDTYTAYPGAYGNANAYEERVRTSGVQLIGLCPVERNVAAGTGKNIFVYDEYGIPAKTANESSEGTNSNSGTDYYDVKILLGDQFKLYQINDNAATVQAQLIAGMQTINSTAVWNLTYRTPYPECDGTERKVDFNLLNKDGNSLTYYGTENDRVYTAPELKVYSEITNPTSDGVFEEAVSGFYRVRGRAWGELKFADALIDSGLTSNQRYPNIKNSMLEIKTREATPQDVYVTSDKMTKKAYYPGASTYYVDSDRVTDSDGKIVFNYIFDVPSTNIIETGADEFDVTVTAYGVEVNGWSPSPGVGTAVRVKADANPPKLVDIKMINTTVATAMNSMKASDSTTNAFNMDITALNTLWYKPYSDTTLASDKTEITNPVLTNRIRKDSTQVPYDGRFVKNGDKLTITAIFIDQNFDETSSTALKNYITGTFTGLETLPVTKTPVITTKSVTLTGGEKAVEITAVWSVTVVNSSTADSIIKMNVTAADKYGNKSSDSDKKNYVGDIEIARLDNVNPGYPEWDSSNPIGNTGGAALTPFAAKKDSAITPVITKDAYRINCYDGATTDTNGIRAFKVYYTYDDTKSDVSSAGLANETGNHDLDAASGDVHWFYIKAGDAVNLSGNTDTITPATGYGEKTPIKTTTNHGDDGKYIFKITAVDKAGNETMYSATIAGFDKTAIETDGATKSRAVYVDTVAPRIDRGQIYVEKYADSPNYSLANYWNVLKNGDKAYIHTKIADFSAISADIGGVATLKDRYYKSGSYPEYSEMIGSGSGTENPVFAVISSSLSSNINTVELKIGDLTYTGGEASPSILISGRANENYLAPIIIGAKDLAGNEFIDSGITCRVDNVLPTTPVIKAYALESNFATGLESFLSDTAENIKSIDRDSAAIHYTNKMDYWIKNSATIDSDVDKVCIISNSGSRWITKAVYTGLLNAYGYYRMIDGTEKIYANYFNGAKMKLIDQAGNVSIDSNTAEILMDMSVPNATIKYIYTSSKPAVKTGNRYAFDIEFSGLKDYTGLQKFVVMPLVNDGTDTAKTVVASGTEISKNQPETTLNTERVLSGSVSLIVPPAKIGTKVNLEVYLYDNMGNKSPKITYVVLVPTPSTELKSIQNNSNKQIRTKIDVVTDPNKNINLKKTEETGKSAQ